MSFIDNYKLLIAELVPFLKMVGYRKSGESFFLDKEGNIGLVNFQRSKNSNSSSILFTINLGVYSSALKMFDSFEVKSKPTLSDCHWRKRIGCLMPDRQDFWWEIDDTISSTKLAAEILDVLKERAIPEVEKFISNESLEKS
ncbi:DUF4304 domain-containing protein [Mucilaginibacter sp.]|uniref:DUF4304 domain-containing protein n=1 Tax=Mucilaginibacter sp. TaxID=1882438 RepID=UPI0035BC6FA4